MKSHIRHTSQKSMGPRSAIGRLLTIAFLCCLFGGTLLAGNAAAYGIELRNSGDGVGTITVVGIDFPNTNFGTYALGPYGTATVSFIDVTNLRITPVAGTASNLISILLNPAGLGTLTGGPLVWDLVNAAEGDEIEVNFDLIQINIDDVSQIESDAGTVNYDFTVSIAGGMTNTSDITFDYATANDTATSGSDYAAVSSSATITAGNPSTTITVVVNGDQVVEGPEQFFVNLSNPVGASIADAQGTGTITDNDTATLTIADVTEIEGTGLLFTVSLDHEVEAGAFTVGTSYSDVTTEAADFDHTSQTLNFAGTAGENQTFTVATTGDAIVEGEETFTVSLSASNTDVDDSDTATGTITDNDTATLTIADVTEIEGTGLLFTVSLDHEVEAGAFTVGTSYSDVTTEAADFDHTSQTLNFAGTAGENQTFTVATTGDAIVEGEETFTVSLSASNTDVDDSDTATGTITDNDTATLTIADVTEIEGTGLLFTVSLDHEVEAGAFTVGTSYSDVTTEAADFDHTSQTLNFAGTAGENQTFTVATTGDAIVEGEETFTVSLSASNTDVDDSDTATGTITDNDTATLTIADVTEIEGTGLLFTVSLDHEVEAGAFTVGTSYSDVTTEAADFDHTSQTLNFAGTAGENQTFTVATTGDAIVEGEETFTVSLSASNTDVDDSDTATGTITDNDTATLTIADVTEIEGTGLLFTVSLDHEVEAGAFTVGTSYSDVTTEAADFDHTSQTLNFAGTAGENQTFTVATTGDAIVEGEETFTVSLSASNTDVDDSDTATGTITDNDTATLTIADVTEIEGTGLLFTVSLDHEVEAGAFTVGTSYSDVTTEAADFDHTSQTLNFAGTAGENQTFTVATTGDAIVEGEETFTVSLSASNTDVDDSDTATGTITDNDTATLTIADVTEIEGTGLLFTVSLDHEVEAGAFTVGTSYSDVTTEAADFDHTSQTLNFAGTAGENQTFTVATTGDAIVEGEETFTVSLSASNTDVDDSDTATGTITDNDTATLTIADVTEIEGTGLLFTVSLDHEVEAGAFTVGTSYSDVTTEAADFDHTSQTLNFAGTAGENQTFTVATTGDAIVEGEETFTVSLSASNTDVDDSDTATGTITDNDTATLTIADVTEIEGTGLLFTVSLDHEVEAGAFTVGTSYSDVTTEAADFDHTSQTLNFAGTAGENQTFTVATTGDAIVEGEETFTVSLSASNTDVDDSDTATGTITDNDTATLTIADVTEIEGTGLLFTVSLDHEVEAGAFTVGTSYSDVTTEAADFDHTSQTLNFAGTAGENQTFTVATTGDAIVEGEETFTVSLSASNTDVDDSDTATGTITDNDTAAVTVEDVSAAEGGGLVFTVTLDNAVQGGFDVNVGLTDGSATGGVDYDNTPPTVSFAGTASETQTFTVTTSDDAIVEGSETFAVALSATNGLVDASDTATGTITDDDYLVSFATVAASASEGNAMTFTVQLDRAATEAVTVQYTVAEDLVGSNPASSPADFSATTQTAAILVGASSVDITVATADDVIDEPDETLIVTLDSVTSGNGMIGSPGEATGTIVDDDYVVTFLVDGNGTLTGSTVQVVSAGGSTSPVTAVPNDSGTYFFGWTGDYTADYSVNPLTIAGVVDDMSVTAVFKGNPVITPSATGSGDIVPPDPQVVDFLGSVTFDMYPESENCIGDVKVDGVSVGAVNTYTFSSVTSNHTIGVDFRDQYEIRGTIQPFNARVGEGGNGKWKVTGTDTSGGSYDSGWLNHNERLVIPCDVLLDVTVAFSTQVGWEAPAPQNVTLSLDTVVTGWYRPVLAVTSADGTVTSLDGGINCNGGGDCTEPYDYNAQVTVESIPNTSFVFKNWAGDIAGAAPTITFIMNEPREIIAVYDAATATNTDWDSDGWTEDDGDCAPYDATIYPGAKELCNDGIDHDCDGLTDATATKDPDCDDATIGISNLPLETLLQAAPANIMFVVDDSGSMDWEFMTVEGDQGLYYDSGAKYYVFDDPGAAHGQRDNNYSGNDPAG